MEKERIMEKRKAFVKRDGDWVEIPFKDVSIGDCVMLYEETGEAVMTVAGEKEFEATSPAMLGKDGMWMFYMIPKNSMH